MSDKMFGLLSFKVGFSLQEILLQIQSLM